MALKDWAPEIVSLDEAEETLNLLVYGDSGVGKTVFAGSADRVLFIASEKDGTISAKRQGSTAQTWPVSNFKELVDALDRLEDNVDEARKEFDWIVIDSVTHMQKMVMRQILDDAVEENPERDPDIPQMQDWQKYQNMFLRIVQAFNDLPINVLWTALARTEENEEGDDFLVPDVQGKGYQMAMTIASYMTSYGYMKASERVIKKNGETVLDEDGKPKKRVIRTITWRDTGPIKGKDRTNVLAPTTTDLTLNEVYSLIKGEETRASLQAKKRAGQAKSSNKAPEKKAPAKKAPAKAVRNPASKEEEVIDIKDDDGFREKEAVSAPQA